MMLQAQLQHSEGSCWQAAGAAVGDAALACMQREHALTWMLEQAGQSSSKPAAAII